MILSIINHNAKILKKYNIIKINEKLLWGYTKIDKIIRKLNK